jgi:WD40 repeat protein
MSLQLKFNAEIKCCGSNKLVITDLTSLYSQQNLGGWGCPNVNFTEVDEAFITVSSLDDNTVEIFNIKPELTTIQNYQGFYTFEEIDFSLIDGVYNVKYTIVKNEETIETVVKVLNTCAIKNCIQDLWLNVAKASCDCKKGTINYIEDAELAEALYKALLSTCPDYNTNIVNNLLSKLNKLCKCSSNPNNDCGCGCK